MAYLTLAGIDENNCFRFIGMGGETKDSANLILSVNNQVSLLSSDSSIDTCSFYSGPTDATIVAFGETSESCGAIAYSGGSESCGSIAYSGGSESCGSIASSSSSSSSSSVCCYSC